MVRRLAAAVMAGALVFSVAILALPIQAHAADTGTVTLVHGVRGLVADIYLDGAVALQVFQPERTAGPLTVPAGAHAVEVRAAGSPPTTPPLLSATLNVPAGSRQSAVVHLNSTGQPALTVYPDDLSAIPAGQARVVLRHAAAAPPIEVQIDRQVVVAALTTNAPAEEQVAAGTHAVAVASGGRNLIPSNDVNFSAGSANFLYLVGSATDNSLVWLAQTVDGLGTAPFAVRSGDGGLAAPREFPYIRVALFCVLAIVFASIAARSSRTPRRWLTTRRWIAAGGVAASVAGIANSTHWAGARVVRDAGSLATPLDAGTTRQKLMTLAPSKQDRPLLGAIATTSARLEDRQVRIGPVPTAVAIEGFGILAPVVPVGADPVTTEMDLPSDPAVAAWYAPGPSPGQTGSAVLASHVDFGGHLGVFFGLTRVDPGARIRVDYEDGSTRWFIVTARRSFAKPDLPVSDLFRRDGDPALVLITCGGQYNRTTRSYSDNVVIYARPEMLNTPAS
ncbi:MAG: DUF4397 domain-containing protein [Acidimicrobiales bacterium]